MVATPLGAAAIPAPAAAWGADGYAVSMQLTSRTTTQLTDGRNHVVATGAADERVYGDTITLSFPLRSTARTSHLQTLRLAGGVAYTGAGPDVAWTRLRVNLDTDRITARVDGGDRRAVLRVTGGYHRDSWGSDDRALVLTSAGARSLNRAAAGSPFQAGDVFAGDSSGCAG